MISIITPTFNSEKTILDSYDSIFNQSICDWEWIVIDDGSKDCTISLVKNIIEKDYRVKLFENQLNKGPAFSRNLGIEMAMGRYLTFLDSDDIWFNNFLEKSLKHMSEHNSGFVFASYERWNHDLTKKIDNFIVPPKVSKKNILYSCPISCLTTMINIEQLGKKQMPDLRKRQDYGLWLEYLDSIDFAYGITEPLAIYRVGTSTVSSNKFKVIKYQFEIYRSHQKLNLFMSIYFLIFWAINGLIKYRFKYF